jgi:hypothetical protein
MKWIFITDFTVTLHTAARATVCSVTILLRTFAQGTNNGNEDD